jgi:5-methylcytosine-specific restriction endonuclease McrA
MNERLHRKTVLVLNRNWQAVNTATPADAFCQMSADVATGLDVQGREVMSPATWEQWLELPIREGDETVSTVRGQIRIPTVIVSCNYDKVPMIRPGFSTTAIRARDRSRCQYTGRVLSRDEGNIDHVVPKSRGGTTSWTNCVWACRKVNQHKGDRLPSEVGLRLIRPPSEPKPVPATLMLTNFFEIEDWEPFLVS